MENTTNIKNTGIKSLLVKTLKICIGLFITGIGTAMMYIAVFIGRQLCTVHARAGYCHRVHLHKRLESRELLLHHSVDHSFEFTQGDVCVQCHLLCSLYRACCHLADCHLRLMDLHHTYSTVDCYCSSHHVHHFSVLSPGRLGGKDTESSGFEEHTWQIRGILMEQTDSAVKRRKKPDSKEG